MKKRVLVLSSSTGSGHDMRAHAFAAWVDKLLPSSHEVHIEQVIENGSLLGRFGVWIYNQIQRYWPWLHNIYFFIVEGFNASHGGGVTFGGRYYRNLLQAYRPDVVLSVHDSTNRGYFEDARKVLGKGVRCVTYCGEYSGGYGYSRHWVNPSADAFIARTHVAADHAIALGMKASRVSVFHKFLPPAAFDPPIGPQQAQQLRTECGLQPDKITLFLATGGYGANHHRAFLAALLPLHASVQLIVVCGRNQTVFNRLQRWRVRHPQLHFHLEGYSSRMAEFMQISDAVITRGGANTTTEALHFNCPILFDAMGGLMPQEHCTVRYLLHRHAARLIRRPADLYKHVATWSDNPQELKNTRLQMQRLIHPEEHPRLLLQEVLNLGKNAWVNFSDQNTANQEESDFLSFEI